MDPALDHETEKTAVNGTPGSDCETIPPTKGTKTLDDAFYFHDVFFKVSAAVASSDTMCRSILWRCYRSRIRSSRSTAGTSRTTLRSSGTCSGCRMVCPKKASRSATPSYWRASTAPISASCCGSCSRGAKIRTRLQTCNAYDRTGKSAKASRWTPANGSRS